MTKDEEYVSPAGVECPVCGISSLNHSHPPNSKPKDFIRLDEDTMLRVAREASCLQRIQMIVWKYMDTPKLERDGVDMAMEIFEDVKKTIKESQ